MDPPAYSQSPVPIPDSIPNPELSDIDLVIAIDFGTTYSGVAYRFLTAVDKMSANLKPMDINRQIEVVTLWPGKEAHSHEKAPTVLAYHSDGRVKEWGFKVNENHKIRVAHFKLGLQRVSDHYKELDEQFSALGDFLANPSWKHQSLPTKKAVDFTADFLTCIRKYAEQHLESNANIRPILGGSKVSYIITVPAIWEEGAKQFTRDAALRAGIPETNLVFIAEPEAAALYCATISQELDLLKGDRFVICDAGGGTVVCPSLRQTLSVGSYLIRSLVSGPLFCY